MFIQGSIGSGFGPISTAADVIRGHDLRGTVAIVTGGTSSIGAETARALAGAGARVVVATRDPARARRVLGATHGVRVDELDLLDPESIDEFARAFRWEYPALHLLVNGAGRKASSLVRDRRGYEAQFSTSHLGHFQLTARLWPALLAAGRTQPGARVITLSSLVHRRSPVDLQDPNFERRDYDRWTACGQSNTASIQFALALDRRGRDHGIRVFSSHPGAREENGARSTDGTGRPRPAADCAATTLWCATSPALAGLGGLYCEGCDVAPCVSPDSPERFGVRPFALDPEQAERLWSLSERLTEVRF